MLGIVSKNNEHGQRHDVVFEAIMCITYVLNIYNNIM